MLRLKLFKVETSQSNMDLIIVGLILDILGVFLLLMASLFGHHYSKNLIVPWHKRYSYMWWTLDFRKDKPLFRKCSHFERPFSPSHYMNMLGFLSVLVGFMLQIIGRL